MTSRDKEFRSVLKTLMWILCRRESFQNSFTRSAQRFRAVGERRRVSVRCDATSRSGNTLCSNICETYVVGSSRNNAPVRMFAIPWNDKYRLMEKLNSNLVRRTVTSQEYVNLQERTHGTCEYNLTLINRMEPSRFESELKNEPMFSMRSAA